MSESAQSAPQFGTAKKSFLPEIGTPGYYVLLGVVAIFILGPLGGIAAAYMNFSLGFFVGGQVLAGILGSAVTYGYGAEGKHGANYIQTMAASVASMAAMAVLIQAMVWLGLPMPHAWQLVLFFTSVGMFGCGVGMLYTPTLVDRMQLMYPSGFAVANILRALTDIRLLKQSIAKLGGGTGVGIVVALIPNMLEKIVSVLTSPANSPVFASALEKLGRVGTLVDESGLSPSTVGAGMIVGARIGIAALAMAVPGRLLTPYLESIGWLDHGAPFRKIGFIIALGMILGATVVDMVLIVTKAVKRLREKSSAGEPQADWQRTNTTRLVLWVAFWSAAVIITGTQIMHAPLLYVVIAVVLAFFFVMGNGISTGITDSNPISSAFVITVFILAAFGLRDPGVGLIAASILLISTATGVDMQQDRSTGWRLGTNRVIQFRFQVIGIVMGAVVAVILAKLFMQAYPVLTINQYAHNHAPGTERWSSAMTFKFVGALSGLTHFNSAIAKALTLGVSIGLVTEIARKLIKGNARYQAWIGETKAGFTTDFLLDSVLLPSPYASSFGGFVELPVSVWWALGGIISSVAQTISKRASAEKKASPTANADNTAESEGGELPEDMSTTSLIGGGLIAGDALAALGVGLTGLLGTLF